jgi:hypothetical protein
MAIFQADFLQFTESFQEYCHCHSVYSLTFSSRLPLPFIFTFCILQIALENSLQRCNLPICNVTEPGSGKALQFDRSGRGPAERRKERSGLIADGSPIFVHAGSVCNLGGSLRLNSLVRASCSGAMILGRVEPIQAVSHGSLLGAAEFSSPDSRCYSGNIGIRYDRMQQPRRQMCISL